MHLREYFDTYDVNIRKFARNSRISFATIYKIMGGRGCQTKTALQIVKATKGKVSLKDLTKFYEDKQKQRKKDDDSKETNPNFGKIDN